MPGEYWWFRLLCKTYGVSDNERAEALKPQARNVRKRHRPPPQYTCTTLYFAHAADV